MSRGSGLPAIPTAAWVALIGIGALLVGAVVVRPWEVALVEHDTGSYVVHLERLVEGRHLEAWLPTTPKPLLSLIYGPLRLGVGAWAPVDWAALLAYGASIALAGWLAARVAGPVAATYAIVAALGSSGLLAQTAGGNALIWAALAWLAAGALLVVDRPRYGLAGLALCLGILARTETVALVGMAIAALLAWPVAARRGWAGPFERSGWLVPIVAMAALPVMLVHDWLLTGDPMFWATVSGRFTAAGADILDLPTPRELAVSLARREAARLPELVLAALGVAVLARRRRWVVACGIVGLYGGTVAFLFLFAFAGTYISPRYYEPLVLATLFGASFGVAGVVAWAVGVWQGRRGPASGGDTADVPVADVPVADARVAAVTILAAALLAVALHLPYGPLAPATTTAVDNLRRFSASLDLALPALRAAVDAVPGSHDPPPDAIGAPVSGLDDALVLAPARVRPRLAVDLDLALTRLDSTSAERVAPTGGSLEPGTILYHDRALDRPAEAWAPLEVDRPTPYGAVVLVPLLADPEHGVWVLRIDAPAP